MPIITLAVNTPFVFASPYDMPITAQTTMGITVGSGGTVALEAMVAPGGSWRAVKTFTANEIYSLNGKMAALRFTAAVAAGQVEITP